MSVTPDAPQHQSNTSLTQSQLTQHDDDTDVSKA